MAKEKVLYIRFSDWQGLK